jgi:hypothetical protein
MKMNPKNHLNYYSDYDDSNLKENVNVNDDDVNQVIMALGLIMVEVFK